jgi:hypothetical protein
LDGGRGGPFMDGGYSVEVLGVYKRKKVWERKQCLPREIAGRKKK